MTQSTRPEIEKTQEAAGVDRSAVASSAAVVSASCADPAMADKRRHDRKTGLIMVRIIAKNRAFGGDFRPPTAVGVVSEKKLS